MKVLKKFAAWLRRFTLKRSAPLSDKLYYSTIEELPVFNWWKINDCGDLSYLLINRRKIDSSEKTVLNIIWKKLYDQYLAVFGVGDSMEAIIQKERNLILMYEDKNVNGNRDVMTFIELAEIEIADMKRKNLSGDKDFFRINAKLQEIIKIPIDMRKISVREYYSYFKNLEDGRK